MAVDRKGVDKGKEGTRRKRGIIRTKEHEEKGKIREVSNGKS